MAEQHRLPMVVRGMTGSFTFIIVGSFLAGMAAAVIGGSMSDLGRGYGGLWGVPSMLLTLVALILGIGAAVKIGRSTELTGGGRLATLVLVGAWVVAIGYVSVAHWVDPCVNGWWDATSRIGSQPLCERFGMELNWHTRFHLLAHATPAALLLVGYVWTVRRFAGARREPVES